MQQFKNIKNELIRRGYGKEEDLKSQVAVLMSVAEMLNGVDLKSKYPVQSHRKWGGGRMRKEMDKERFQIRKNKKNDALDSLREFITRERLVNGSSKRMEQLDVVEVILKYIKPDSVDDTVDDNDSAQPPVLSLTPGLPDVIPAGGVLPFQPAPKLNFPRTVNPFQQMMQMNLQKQLQYQQTFPTMKNLLNTDQVTPNEEVEEPSSSAIAQPAEDSEEEELYVLN